LGNVYIFVYSFMYFPAIVDQPLLYPVILVSSRQSRTPFNAGQSPNPWRRGVCSLVPVSATLNLTKCDKLRNYFSQKMFCNFSSVLCFFYFLSGLVLFCSACRWAEIDKRRGGAWIRIRIRGSAALFGARCKCLDKGSDLCGSSWELLGGAAGDDNSSSNPLNAASHSPYPIPGWAKSEVPAI